MKNLILFFFLVSSLLSIAQEKPKNVSESVLITSKKDKTQLQTNENGELLVNVSPKDASGFKAKGLVRYSDFGAKGDGKTDDVDAIAAAHAFAN